MRLRQAKNLRRKGRLLFQKCLVVASQMQLKRKENQLLKLLQLNRQRNQQIKRMLKRTQPRTKHNKRLNKNLNRNACSRSKKPYDAKSKKKVNESTLTSCYGSKPKFLSSRFFSLREGLKTVPILLQSQNWSACQLKTITSFGIWTKSIS